MIRGGNLLQRPDLSHGFVKLISDLTAVKGNDVVLLLYLQDIHPLLFRIHCQDLLHKDSCQSGILLEQLHHPVNRLSLSVSIPEGRIEGCDFEIRVLSKDLCQELPGIICSAMGYKQSVIPILSTPDDPVSQALITVIAEKGIRFHAEGFSSLCEGLNPQIENGRG